MTGYPVDWDARREAVRLRDQNRCINCRVSGDDVTFNTHHVVPISQGGSHRMSNLVLLCKRCHDAAHGKRMAPVVKLYTNGAMTEDEFDAFQGLVKSLDVAQFHSEKDYWFIPKADAEMLEPRFAS